MYLYTGMILCVFYPRSSVYPKYMYIQKMKTKKILNFWYPLIYRLKAVKYLQLQKPYEYAGFEINGLL